MYSAGHIVFIIISLIMIVLGVLICKKNKFSLDSIIKVCFFVAVVCEFIKVLTVIDVWPIVQETIENGEIVYSETGRYTPFIEYTHLPFELCSLQIIFMFLYLVIRDAVWKKRIIALIYGTAFMGGLLAIFVSSIAGDFITIKESLTSLRAWEFYIYHSMLTSLAILIATDGKYSLKIKEFKWTCLMLLIIDIFSFYINSILSIPVYRDGKLIGLSSSVNYFSSFDNPLGIPMVNKWQYLIYLMIRLMIGFVLIFIIYLPFLKNKRGK